MDIEWDESKRRSNLRNHGIDFLDAAAVFDGYTVTAEDTRRRYGEARFVTFGLLQGRVVAVVHTERSEKIRLISIRKATRHEQKSYFESIRD